MPTIPRRLKLLEKKLDELSEDVEPMLVSQIEGFLAGIIVCPDLIMPGEWLPLIWGVGDEEEGPVFESVKQAERLMGLVMEHYNATISAINAGRYAPVYDVDTRNDDVIWEMWIDGFEQAMQLRPQSWSTFLGMDEDTRIAIAGLLTLADIANGKSKLPKKDIDELQLAASDLIPAWVEGLNAARTMPSAAASPPAHAAKIGRNEPCHCGSGKKYKKCCGLN